MSNNSLNRSGISESFIRKTRMLDSLLPARLIPPFDAFPGPANQRIFSAMSFTFEWDDAKALENLKKHGISFSEASTVFADPLARTISDPLHSAEEGRFVILGQSGLQHNLVVVHTYRGEIIRIISARPATPGERKDYERGKE